MNYGSYYFQTKYNVLSFLCCCLSFMSIQYIQEKLFLEMTNCRNGLGIKVKFMLMPQCIINEKYLLLSNYYHFKIYTCKNRPKIPDIFVTIDDLINFPDTQNFWQFLTLLTEWTSCFYSWLKPLNLLEFPLNKSLSFLTLRTLLLKHGVLGISPP